MTLPQLSGWGYLIIVDNSGLIVKARNIPISIPSMKNKGRNSIFNLLTHQKMLADVMRNPKFGFVFSFILGVGLAVIVFQANCRAGECKVTKAPSPKDVEDQIYIIGSDCYKFSPKQMKCPDNGDIIESFKLGFKNKRD